MGSDMLIFSAGNNYYALLVEKVVRVLWALEVIRIPNSPEILYGVFDLHGKTTPVISIRKLFTLGQKEMQLEDALIVLKVHSQQMALLVDGIIGVFNLEEEDSSEAEKLFAELSATHVVKFEDRLIPVLDIDKLIDDKTVKRAVNVDD